MKDGVNLIKKLIITLLILAFVIQADPGYGAVKKPVESRELQFQDMLMLFLLPHLEKKLAEIYLPYLTAPPQLYPYFIDVISVKRVNGFRGFDFLITLEVTPTVGPHIAVGKDRLTFEIAPTFPDNVKFISAKHLEGPNKKNFPPNYLDLLRKNSHQYQKEEVGILSGSRIDSRESYIESEITTNKRLFGHAPLLSGPFWMCC